MNVWLRSKAGPDSCLVRQAFLVHQAAYDEMCCGPESGYTLSLAAQLCNNGR